MRNLLFHGFVLFKYECHTLFKHGSRVHDFHVETTQIDIQHLCLNNTKMHVTFVFKQCTNDTSRWMTFVFILNEPMESKFRTTIIAKLWPMKFLIHPHYLIMFMELQTIIRFWFHGCETFIHLCKSKAFVIHKKASKVQGELKHILVNIPSIHNDSSKCSPNL